MASIKLYHDTRAATKDGRCQIKISISHKGASALLGTGVFVRPEHWCAGNAETEPYIKKTCVGHKALNSIVTERFDRVNSEILVLIKQNEIYTFKNATQLKQYLLAKIEGQGGISFSDYFLKFISQKTNPNTKELYLITFDKVMTLSDGKPVQFEDISASWLLAFEQHIRYLAVNTRGIHLRNIRAVINSAINNEVTEIKYPFRHFKIKKQETKKRSLTIEQIKTIRDYPCEPHMRQYVDIFMLIFYLRGINIVDLCRLTDKNIHNGHIEYYRAKTNRLYFVKIEPEAQKIIDKHRGEKYLLNILDRYKNYQCYRSRLNRNLKQLGPVKILPRKNGRAGKKEFYPIFPELSTYWARHSWATIASKLGIPKDTIAAGLGHGQKTTTDIYIDFDMSKVDEANRMVLDSLRNMDDLKDNA